MKNLWMPCSLERVKLLKALALESETLGFESCLCHLLSVWLSAFNSVPWFSYWQNGTQLKGLLREWKEVQCTWNSACYLVSVLPRPHPVISIVMEVIILEISIQWSTVSDELIYLILVFVFNLFHVSCQAFGCSVLTLLTSLMPLVQAVFGACHGNNGLPFHSFIDTTINVLLTIVVQGKRRKSF